MSDARDVIARVVGLHEGIASDVPEISRGKVWCISCGREQAVNGAECLRSGWPKCCGFTMTIDSPDDARSLLNKEAET